jgi:adenylosuccinate synthase
MEDADRWDPPLGGPPLNCRHYLLTIAQLTGTRLTIVSVGPARDQTMFL